MWILESNGDFLQGKRIWLRPGKKYLFGRVKKEGVSHAIDHKTISRKHFVIEVASVTPGDCTHLHTRSRITVSDEKSKGGTQVDGHPLRARQKLLDKTEHSLRPGTYPHELRIKWVPVCLNFSLSNKERKSGDPLASRRKRLEELDIKASLAYVVDKTTHVVQAKRNTVSGLQALLNGKYIVTDEYVDALVYAATPDDLEELENLCPLERDFDAAWPDPLRYLPSPGKEQIEHPAAAFAPNPERSTVFEDYTFVFGDPKQQENILPAISNGHGKALVCKVEHNKTTADDIVRFMQNAAGEKGFGDFNSPSEKGGVILVRWLTKPDIQGSADRLANEVALRIDQRPIEQREFLDAIVINDARTLRRALEFADSTNGEEPPPTAPSFESNPPRANERTRRASEPEETQEEARRSEARSEVPSRQPKSSRNIPQIKAFDDGFDMDSIASFTTPDNAASQDVNNEAENGTPGISMSPTPEKEQGHGKRKRSPARDDEEDMVDELLPAAAAMKKRRLEANQVNGGKSSGQLPTQLQKKAKAKPEIDVRENVRKHREAEEEVARQDKEALNATLNADELKKIKETLVEIMDIPVRTSRPTQSQRNTDGRWDEKWNGRKNFKGFRRKGDANWRQNHSQKIMVPLVEAKKQSFGIGQKYWSDSESDKDRRKKKSSRNQRQNQTQIQSQTQRLEEHASPVTKRLQREAAQVVGEVDIEQPRTTRLADKTQQSQQTMDQTQGLKRPGSSAGGNNVKRQKTLRPRESDEDDEPKFRFGRRKKT